MRTKEKAQICKRTNYVEGGNYEKQIIQKNRQHSINVRQWLRGCLQGAAVHRLVTLLARGGGKEIANEDIKIGISIWSSTDVLGSQCKRILDAAAEALGVQIQYVDQAHVSEKVTASVEQLCAAGCQGIIVCNSADTEMTSAIKTCNDNGVYLSQFFRVISEKDNPDIYQVAKDSEYFIGAVHENEVENGKQLVKMLLDKGDRNIGLIGWEQGDAPGLADGKDTKRALKSGTKRIQTIRRSFQSHSMLELPLTVDLKRQKL